MDGERLLISADNKLMRFHGYYDELIEGSSFQALYTLDTSIYYGMGKEYGTINLQNSKNPLNKIYNDVSGEVAYITRSNYGNFILADNAIYHFQDKGSKKYSFPGIVSYLGNVNNSVILQDDTNGLSIFVGGRFKIVNNSRLFSTMKIVEIKSVGSGEYIVATDINGLYRFDGESFYPFGSEFTEGKKIVDIEVINTASNQLEILMITDAKELISLDDTGSLIAEKLFTNRLYDISVDASNRVFVVTQSGIEVLFYNLPLQVIDLSPDPIHGPVKIYDNKLYWGTNNGLFYSHILEKGNLLDARVRVKDTEGKVGQLDVVSETLLMTHVDGLYDILPRIGARFIPDERFFGFQSLKEDYLLAFGDRNTYLLKKIRNRWRKRKVIEGFPVHPKSSVFDIQDRLWIVDRDYKLMEYEFDARSEQLTLKNSESNIDKTKIFQIDSTVVLIKKDGVFNYNYDLESWEISDELTAIFGDQTDVEELVSDEEGNIWYIINGKVGVFSLDEKKSKYINLDIDIPYANARSIFPYDINNVFINNEDYIIKLDLENYKKQEKLMPSIARIVTKSANSSSVMYDSDGLLNTFQQIYMAPEETMHIYMDSDLYPDARYEYSISDQREQLGWQVSPVPSEIVLENLEAGNYFLKIRNRNYLGVSKAIGTTVSIAQPLTEGRNLLIIASIAGILFLGISFVGGYLIGERRRHNRI